jgi:hypothetical protein
VPYFTTFAQAIGLNRNPILIDSGAPNDEMACSIIENLGRDKAALLIQALKLNLAADTTKVDQTKH